jgi:hypothetical protein
LELGEKCCGRQGGDAGDDACRNPAGRLEEERRNHRTREESEGGNVGDKPQLPAFRWPVKAKKSARRSPNQLLKLTL